MITVHTFTSLEGHFKKISFSHDGKYIATASDEHFIEFYNVDECKIKKNSIY
jgi:hypothetical protein